MRGIPSDFRMKKGDLSIKISDIFPFINFSCLISLVYVFLSKIVRMYFKNMIGQAIDIYLDF